MTVLVTDKESQLFRDYGYLIDMAKRVRPLSGSERIDAEGVFHNSVDYDRVLVSNASGFQGRAYCELAYFKVTVDTDGKEIKYEIPFNILNISGGWGDDYPRRLHHEMTHVWQSQHATDPYAYFKNSMRNQAYAYFRFLDGNRAYEFVPGFPFSRYNSEQLARAVGTHQDSAIIGHIRSVKKNTLDALNEASLNTVNAGDMTGPVEPSFYNSYNLMSIKHMY